MSSNSRSKPFISPLDQILESQNKIQDLYSIIREKNTPRLGTRSSFGAARLASITGGLNNPDVVIVGIISYDIKLVPLTSTTLDVSKANLGLPGSVDGFTSRLVVPNFSAFNLETIAGAEHAGQYLEIQGVVTESIVIKHGVGNIRTQNGSDVTITGNQIATLRFDSIALEWVVVLDPAGGGTSFIGFVADADLDMGTFDIKNVDRYLPVIDSEAFPSTSTAGILLSSVGQHYNVASLKTHKLQIEEVDFFVVSNSPLIEISLQGNDLTSVDDFFFTTSGTSILHDSGGIHSNVPFGDILDSFISSVKEFEVRAGEINLHGNDLAAIDDLFFSAGGVFRSGTLGWDWELPLNDDINILFNGVLQFEINAIEMNFHGNRINDLADILFSTIGHQISSFPTSMAYFVFDATHTHDFFVNAVNRFSVTNTSIECNVDVDLNDNDVLKIKTNQVKENFAIGFSPVGVTDTAIVFTRPDGAGKTLYRIKFQTGTSVQTAQEP